MRWPRWSARRRPRRWSRPPGCAAAARTPAAALRACSPGRSAPRGRPGAPGSSWPGWTPATTAPRCAGRPAARVFFSVTARLDAAVKAAIAAIPGQAWTAIGYPRAIWDDQLAAWVSDAEIAEVSYTAFASRKGQAITARLIVRRVKDLNRKAAEGQDELSAVWRYHPVFTDSPFTLAQAEEQHRDHAVVEQVFADWTSGPMAHLPSGSFAANAAWLTLAAITHNLTRAAGCLASAFHARARGATILRDLIDVAARTARHCRGHLTLHLPQGWHRETEWMTLFQAACGPPRAQAA